jgi:hypothetical protein
MFTRLAVANTLAAFAAASAMFFFIAGTAPRGVHHHSPYGASGLKSAFSKPSVVETTMMAMKEAKRNREQFISSPTFMTLPVGSNSEQRRDNNQTAEKSYMFADQSIDLGEIVIQGR